MLHARSSIPCPPPPRFVLPLARAVCAGSRLRRDVMATGGVAPVAASSADAAAAAAVLGGQEEQFAFKRAVSRLYEMQSPLFGRGEAVAAASGAAAGGGGSERRVEHSVPTPQAHSPAAA
jgi:hypothetical protein